MFIEILIAILFGILFGIFTGLIPGIHINLVCILLLSASPILLNHTTPITLAVFIIAMATTHSFLDSIPSIFLGAPDSDQVLNVLPGHKLLLEGKGFEAVKLTVIGSLLCLIFSVSLIPLLIPTVNFIYPHLKNYIGHILIVIITFMILKDKQRINNFIIFSLSGILGIIVLNMPNLKQPLFPLLSGLFGTSMLVISLLDNTKIPKQTLTESIEIKTKTLIKAITAGTFAGTLTSFFPGLGPAQGAVLASQITRKLNTYGFMILVGGINTVNFILSLITLLVIDKARNGAVIVISKLININKQILLIFIAAALITGAISTILTLNISKIFAKLMSKINYKITIISVLTLITLLVIYFSGPIGLVVLIVSTSIGVLPSELQTSRNHQMGCLILPVILFFIL